MPGRRVRSRGLLRCKPPPSYSRQPAARRPPAGPHSSYTVSCVMFCPIDQAPSPSTTPRPWRSGCMPGCPAWRPSSSSTGPGTAAAGPGRRARCLAQLGRARGAARMPAARRKRRSTRRARRAACWRRRSAWRPVGRLAGAAARRSAAGGKGQGGAGEAQGGLSCGRWQRSRHPRWRRRWGEASLAAGQRPAAARARAGACCGGARPWRGSRWCSARTAASFRCGWGLDLS
jgi:hypothetical protein